MNAHRILGVLALVLSTFWAAGCASHPNSDPGAVRAGQITIPYTDTAGESIFAYRPTIEASIDGVPGRFILDTGAAEPSLTTTAVSRCKIAVSRSSAIGVDASGSEVPLMSATNITVKLAPDFSIHFPSVLVLPTQVDQGSSSNHDFFGVLDYRTLRAGHAVMDMKYKTITLSR